MNDIKNCRIISAEINFPKNVTNPNSREIEAKKTEVHCYSVFKEISSLFTFPDHGFQFVQFDGELVESQKYFIQNYKFHYEIDGMISNIKLKIGEALSKNLVCYLTEWAKKNISNFDPEAGDFIVPFGEAFGLNGIHYRDATPSDKWRPEAAIPFPTAHADFNQKEYLPTVKSTIRKAVNKTLAKNYSEDDCQQFNVIQTINVWMSLNFKAATNTLAVMNSKSFNPNQDLIPFQTEIASLSIYPNSEQRWVTFEGMTLSQGIIFKTDSTVHAAIDLDCPGEFRKSAEARFVALKAIKDGVVL